MTQYVIHILRVCLNYCLFYPACKASSFCVALYFRVWPSWFYHILHIIPQTTRF